MKLLFLLLLSSPILAQWRPASDRLVLPEKLGHAESGFGWINKYDTVPILYRNQSDTTVLKGWRKVYCYNGMYIDDARTYKIFFDRRRERIFDVREWKFD